MMSPHTPEERPIGALLAPDLLAMLEESPADVAGETEEMHPADLADIAEALPNERVAALLAALPADRAADVLEYLDEDLRSEVLEAMTAPQAALLLARMTPDDRADALDELERDVAEDILAEIPLEARRETERLLAFEPDTAGGLLTTEVVSVSQDRSVETARAGVRAIARTGKKEAMYAIYATDRDGRLQGVMSLRELLAAPEGARVSDVAWSEVRSVTPDVDREAVARMTSNYDLVAVPVIDGNGRLVGVVTVDDVIDAIQEEQTEDAQKFGGLEALDEPYMQIGFLSMMRKRAGWLSVLFLGQFLTAAAMQGFEGQLAQAVMLVAFIPLIISSGGNSGSQATSLIIRAMALEEIDSSDWWRVALRELRSGLSLGVILGVLGFLRVALWQALGWYDYGPNYLLVASTIGLALLGVVAFGSLMGAMLPFGLRRLGADPASASAPFVATLVDVTGLLIYFGAALVLLRGTLL